MDWKQKEKVNMQTSCFHAAFFFFFFLILLYYAGHKQKYTKAKMIYTQLINAGKYCLWSQQFCWEAQFTGKRARQKERKAKVTEMQREKYMQLRHKWSDKYNPKIKIIWMQE